MRFSRFRQPRRNRSGKPRRRSPYSPEYRADRREELHRLLASAKTDAEREALIKAYSVTISP